MKLTLTCIALEAERYATTTAGGQATLIVSSVTEATMTDGVNTLRRSYPRSKAPRIGEEREMEMTP